MIKRLRIKFICVVMAIVAVMLAVILGVVIWFTGQNMQTQSISMMRSVAASPFHQGGPGKPLEGVRIPFFAVQIGNRGEILTTSGGYFDLSDQEYLTEIVNTALASRQDTGKLEGHNLRFLKDHTPRGQIVIFADTTAETATMRNLFYSCLAIFFGALTVFLGVSIFLSRWATKPVAKAWDQQRQFVADASHELKTPLSVIMTSAELMQQETTAEEQQKFSRNILTMTYQMRSLVENLLEMARVDNGRGKMNFESVDFSQLVSDAVLSFQLLYEEKNMSLESAVAEGICLQGSEQHLYQVLDVLLDNGLKYATPDAPVRVELRQMGRDCLLSVASSGVPLSAEELKNIFKRFYRGDKARSSNGSYGLGLSIAEGIVQAHKGKIWARSHDGYNIFYVQLPV